MNPYIVLGVSPTASDAEIREAYLKAIKTNSPDRAPEKFQEIAAAYSKIKDEDSRIDLMLFNRESPGESPLATVIAATPERRPLPFDRFQSFLRKCAKN